MKARTTLLVIAGKRCLRGGAQREEPTTIEPGGDAPQIVQATNLVSVRLRRPYSRLSHMTVRAGYSGPKSRAGCVEPVSNSGSISNVVAIAGSQYDHWQVVGQNCCRSVTTYLTSDHEEAVVCMHDGKRLGVHGALSSPDQPAELLFVHALGNVRCASGEAPYRTGSKSRPS